MSASRSPNYGPFEIISETKGEGRELVNIPFADVAGAQLVVIARDNFAKLAGEVGLNPSNLAQYWALAEVTVWGAVADYRVCLKRQAVKMGTGPLQYTFAYENVYQAIIVRGINMTGGRRGSYDNGTPGSDIEPSGANGFSLQLSIMIQPRSGFGEKK